MSRRQYARIDLTELRTLAEAEQPRVRHGGVDAPSIHLPTATVLRLLDALEAVLSEAHWLWAEHDRARYGDKGCGCPQCRMTQRVITILKGADDE